MRVTPALMFYLRVNYQSGVSVTGVCRLLPTPEENKCCEKRTCVTAFELFQNICIDREVLRANVY